MILKTLSKLQAVTTETPSSALTFYIDYVEIETTKFGVSDISAIDGTFGQVITDILGSPSTGHVRQVKGIKIYNPSNGTQEITLYVNVSGVLRVINKLQVSTLCLLEYQDGQWQESKTSVIGSDLLTLTARASNPTVPGEGTLLIYDYPIAGRQIPRFIGPAGLDSALQPALFGNGIIMVSPNTTTTFSVLGTVATTNVGTVSHPALNASSIRQSSRRGQVLSVATANAASEVRIAYASVWRGNAAGLGGFFFRCRFAIGSNVLTQRLMVGLTSSTGATATTIEPSSLLNCIFIGNDSTDSNLQVMVNDASGACSKVDLGTDFPAVELDAIYDVTFFTPSNSSFIGYSINKLTDGKTATGAISDNLPSQITFLAPHVYLNNGGTAASVTLDLMRIYIETDQ